MKNLVTTKFLQYLTDDFGVWQHCTGTEILRSEGYALDDSARALVVYLLFDNFENARVCLRYIEKSLKEGKFIGFFNEHRESIVYPSSFDAFGLAIWSLAYAINAGFETDRCQNILDQINFTELVQSEYIRTRAYLLIATSILHKQDLADDLVNSLLAEFNDEFKWFENRLLYANGILPYALLMYCQNFELRNDKIKLIIIESIATLEKHMHIGVIPAPIGNREWHEIGNISKDIYGQQPIDAAFMVLLLLKAYEYFGDSTYLHKAQNWASWFTGNNIFQQSLINDQDGCADGIDENGVSENHGSESTIMYVWAFKSLEQAV